MGSRASNGQCWLRGKRRTHRMSRAKSGSQHERASCNSRHFVCVRHPPWAVTEFRLLDGPNHGVARPQAETISDFARSQSRRDAADLGRVASASPMRATRTAVPIRRVEQQQAPNLVSQSAECLIRPACSHWIAEYANRCRNHRYVRR